MCVCVCWLEEMGEKKAGYTLGFRTMVSKCLCKIKFKMNNCFSMLNYHYVQITTLKNQSFKMKLNDYITILTF